MVRNYKRKTNRQNWLEISMAMAVEAVNDGKISCSKAAKTFGIPRSTLQRRVLDYRINNDMESAVVKGLGRFQSVFTPSQEAALIDYVHQLETQLHGLTPRELRILAYQLAEKNNIAHPFINGIAGEDWLRGFLIRNPSVTLRKPKVSMSRSARFNRVVVSNFFYILEMMIKKYNLKPDRIFNVDETSCTSVRKHQSKILAKKERKQVDILTSAEQDQKVTIEICASASGQYLPPMFVFPCEKMKQDLLNGSLPGSWGVCNPSGSMQGDLFLSWFKWFVEQVQPTAEDPVLLLLDGHTSHTNNLDIIEYARVHRVTILCFPPHCTHRLQPLDVSLTKPISSFYSNEVQNWLRLNPGQVVTPENVPMLFSNVLKKAAKPMTIQNGFKKTGIWPLNPNIFNDLNFAQADVTNQNEATSMVDYSETGINS